MIKKIKKAIKNKLYREMEEKDIDIEDGEKVLTAAKREVGEETNLKIVNDIYFLASKKVTKKN